MLFDKSGMRSELVLAGKLIFNALIISLVGRDNILHITPINNKIGIKDNNKKKDNCPGKIDITGFLINFITFIIILLNLSTISHLMILYYS